MGGRWVGEFQRSLSSVLARFSEYWKVYFTDMTIKAKDDFKVGFDDIARQVGDNHNFSVRFFCRGLRVYVHFCIFI